jgi:N-acyl-D-amino-acid deacylase
MARLRGLAVPVAAGALLSAGIWAVAQQTAPVPAPQPDAPAPEARTLYDVVIRNGHIVDGTGSPWYSGDIAIRDGRIVRIVPSGLTGEVAAPGLASPGPATQDALPARNTIDAHGMIVAPGFIDMLGQSERSVLREPHLPSKIFQGITTEITGEGNSIAPRSEKMLAAGTASGATEFRSFAEYFKRFEAGGSAINLGSYVGATTVRRMLLGDENRAPTPAELAQMQAIVRQAMRDGAVGISTSLMYAPAPFARTEELIALARAAAAEGGIYATHMRSEADGLYAALDETFRIAREAKIPVEIFHLKVAGKANWGEMPEVVRRIEAARAEGLDIAADTYAYTVSGNPFSAMIPPWAHDGGDAAMVARLKDPNMRAKIRDGILHDRSWDNEWYMIAGPEGVWISSTSSDALKPLQGKTLAEVATMRGTDAIDTLMDLLAEDPRMGVLLATMDEADVAYALKQPWVSVGLDAGGGTPALAGASAGGHPRAYATFPRILRKYVLADGLLTLPDAIRKFSALPAQRMHLADRGVLKAGMWADVVVFDPAKVRDLATFERPDQLALGMDYVLVNGVPVIAEGKMTDALPGKAVRGAGWVQ